MKKVFAVSTLLFVLLLVACGPNSQVQDLTNQVESLQADLQEAQSNLAEATARVTELEGVETELESVETELEGAKEELSAAEATITELETELETVQSVINEAAEEIAEVVDDESSDTTEITDASESEATDPEDTVEDTSTDEANTDTPDTNAEAEETNVDSDEPSDETGADMSGEEADTDVSEESSEASDTTETDAEANAEDNDSEDTNSEDAADADTVEDTDTDTTTEDEADSDTEDNDDPDTQEDSDENEGDAGSDATNAAAAAVTGAAAAAVAANVDGGETITVAITAEPPGWDPSASTSQEIARVMYHNVFEGLVRFDESGEIVPALAESWEISDDGLSWTFSLREGVKFHDGSDFTVEDVIAKFERAKDPDSGHTHPEYYEAIESIEAGEGNSVIFTLEKPASSLLYNLARPDSVIYPAAKADTQASEPVGTGPFRFAEYTEGSEVRLERFADYYIDGVPQIDTAVFKIIPDPNTRFAALQAGDIDLIGTSLPPEQFIQLDDNDDLQGAQGSATTEITLAMNNSVEPLNNPLVRQAITHAIDKNAIVDGAMFGLGTVIGTHMSPSEPYYIDLSETYPFDPDKARELLAEAGYEDGFEIRFELPEPYNIERRAGQVIAQQLEEVGISVDLSVVEWGTWIQRIFLGGDYDMTIIGHSEPRDINVYGNPDYYYKYDNDAVRDLLKSIEATTDPEEQVSLFQDIARTIADDAVNVWVFSPPYLVAARSDIEGFWTNQPTPSIDMTNVRRVN